MGRDDTRAPANVEHFAFVVFQYCDQTSIAREPPGGIRMQPVIVIQPAVGLIAVFLQGFYIHMQHDLAALAASEGGFSIVGAGEIMLGHGGEGICPLLAEISLGLRITH